MLVAALTAAVTLLGVVHPAAAAEPTEAELAVARDRFKEGLELEAAGDFRAARAKFEQVAETRTSPQVLYHLALCDENLGSLVAAEKGYQQALAEAERAGEAAIGVVETAQPRLAKLRPRIPHLRIAIEGVLEPGDQVTLDSAFRDEWAEPIAVDPGRRVVAVLRAGRRIAETTVQAAEGEQPTARLTLPSAAAPGPTPPPPPPATDQGGGPPAAALVVGGIGIASVAVGAVTLAMRQVAIDEVRATCTDPEAGTGCDSRVSTREDDAHVLTVASVALFGVGAACIATGAVLWVTLDDAPAAGSGPTPRAARRALVIAPAAGGLLARGSF